MNSFAAERTSRSLKSNTFWKLGLPLLAFALLKVFIAANIELLHEEAYYWTYLQHPALSYFDHPPIVSWIIGGGTFLWGDTELGVRFGTILLSLLSSLLIFALAHRWFGERPAWWATGLFNLIPVYLGIGLLTFPDGPLLFFWLLFLYAITHALGIGKTEKAQAFAPTKGLRSYGWWMLAGVAWVQPCSPNIPP